MNGGLMMRSSRLRTVLYGIVLLGIAFIVYLLSSTHSQLKEIEGSNEKCQQQKDSLSAQLQVAYEYKNRLERSLQKEKGDHKHQQEEMLKQNTDLRAQIEKEKQEASRKYSKLLKDHQSLQNRQQQLEVEVTQLQNAQKNLEEEKKQMGLELTHQIQSLQHQKDNEIAKLQVLLNNLMQEKDALQQTSMKEAWEKKHITDNLELCQNSYDKLKEKCEIQGGLVKQNRTPRGRQHDKLSSAPHHQAPKISENAENKENKDPSVVIKKVEELQGNVVRNNSPSALIGPKPSSSTSPQSAGFSAQDAQRQDDSIHAQVQPPNNYNNNHVVGNNLKINPVPEEENPRKPLGIPAPRFENYPENRVEVPPEAHRPNADAFGGPGGPFNNNNDIIAALRPPYDSRHRQGSRLVERSANFYESPHQAMAPNHPKHKIEPFHLEQSQKFENIKRGPAQRIGREQGFMGMHVRYENEENDAGDDGADDDNDDPDPDNGLDDQAVGAGHRANGKVFQDADFDDQENEGENQNQGNQEGEEGVAVVPK